MQNFFEYFENFNIIDVEDHERREQIRLDRETDEAMSKARSVSFDRDNSRLMEFVEIQCRLERGTAMLPKIQGNIDALQRILDDAKAGNRIPRHTWTAVCQARKMEIANISKCRKHWYNLLEQANTIAGNGQDRKALWGQVFQHNIMVPVINTVTGVHLTKPRKSDDFEELKGRLELNHDAVQELQDSFSLDSWFDPEDIDNQTELYNQDVGDALSQAHFNEMRDNQELSWFDEPTPHYSEEAFDKRMLENVENRRLEEEAFYAQCGIESDNGGIDLDLF